MILNFVRKEQYKPHSRSHIKSILKALSWRFIGTLDTVLISYLLVGDAKIAFGIGSIEVISKIVLYYFHERLWNRVSKKNQL